MVSLTRLHLRSVRFLPQFLWLNERIVRQLAACPGFRGGKLLADRGWTFWTATDWQAQSSMRSFRDSGAHRESMPRLLDWCDEAAVAESNDWESIPEWQEIYRCLREQGRASRLRYASPRHPERDFPPPQWTVLQRNIHPGPA